MQLYKAKFRHLSFGTPIEVTAEARNPQAAIARCARAAGLKAKRKNCSWQFWHNQNFHGVQCYSIAEIYPL